MSKAITVTLPLRTLSPNRSRNNLRQWMKMKAEHRTIARTLTVDTLCRVGRSMWVGIGQDRQSVWDGFTITLTRLAPRTLDDDNAIGSMKSARDGVSDALGVDDSDPRLTWRYGQEKARDYSVRVEIQIQEV